MNKYTAIYAETPHSGVGIIRIEQGAEDYVISEPIGKQSSKEQYRNKLCWTADGRQFFKMQGKRYFLDEFMRTNI